MLPDFFYPPTCVNLYPLSTRLILNFLMTLQEKYEKLKSLFREMGSVAVAYSGGVDSALVLAVAHSVLNGNTLAVTGRSASLAQRERIAATDLAKKLGVAHHVIDTQEVASPDYAANPINRCYYCKSELYSKLREVADQRGLKTIVNGTNVDDLGDHRPGLESAREANVRSPLCEAGFTKQDVRDLARQLGLPVWDKPAMPCLSSRIPYEQAGHSGKTGDDRAGGRFSDCPRLHAIAGAALWRVGAHRTAHRRPAALL